MIIHSRNRDETPYDTEYAESLAERFKTTVLSIPFLYDLRRSGRTAQNLRELACPILFVAPLPVRVTMNLLQFLDIPCDDKLFFQTGVPIEIGDFSWKPSTEIAVRRWEEPTTHRWYPVIDVRECTGCLECVNFCLFGVYVIGQDDKPFVDQPDACRDGCPACSRVCPGAAIMFPMHEDPDISGRNDPEAVRFRHDTRLADRERSRHLPLTADDELDEFVDQVDHFSL